MRRFHPQPRFYLLMLVVVIAVFAVSYGVAAGKLREGEAKLAERDAERNALSSQISQLQSEIDFAQTDAYIERVARDELGLIMPGEVRYVGN